MNDLILFGVQGSGKGTQGVILAKEYEYTVFDTGSALRNIAKTESELGKKVKNIMNEGELVPTEVVMQVIEDFIKKYPDTTKFLFDGIPRNEEQLEQFEALMKKNHKTPTALWLDIGRELAEKRLLSRKMCKSCPAIYGGDYESDKCEKCGGELYTREDDNIEAITKRIDVFFEETAPIIHWYEAEGRLVKIDGSQSIGKVTNEMEKKIEAI